jgi:hypothetical protein
VLDADPRRVKRIRITRLKVRREIGREPRKLGEPDVVLAGTTSPSLPTDDAAHKDDDGRRSAGNPASARRP